MDSNNLAQSLNNSGFVLQHYLEQAWRDPPVPEVGWRYGGSEHYWNNGTKYGYIDLLINVGAVTFVIDCKLARRQEWVFLLASDKRRPAMLLHRPSQEPCTFHWMLTESFDDLPLSRYCVTGQSEGQRTMIEHTAADLVLATESVLLEREAAQRHHVSGLFASWGDTFIPTIITTARLQCAKVGQEDIDKAKGEIRAGGGVYKEQPAILFQKGFASTITPIVPTRFIGSNPALTHVNAAQQRTVLILNVASAEQQMIALAQRELYFAE